MPTTSSVGSDYASEYICSNTELVIHSGFLLCVCMYEKRLERPKKNEAKTLRNFFSL